MTASLQTAARETTFDSPDETVAALTDIAYRALLSQGLSRAFVDVELDLWKEIRQAYSQRRTGVSRACS